MYVDDLLLLANSTTALDTMITKLNNFLDKNFAIANTTKTEIMARHDTSELRRWLKANSTNTDTLENKQTLKYLGLTITMNNNWEHHIAKTLTKVDKCFYALHKQGIHWNQLDPLSCIHLIKSLVTPILNYGAEIIELKKH